MIKKYILLVTILFLSYTFEIENVQSFSKNKVEDQPTYYLPMAMGTSRAPSIENCPVFPLDNVWNTRIDHLPVHSKSNQYIASIGADSGIHPDFGTVWNGAPIGIPFNLVDSTQPLDDISFEYADESDPGPYPIPDNPLIEGGVSSDGDRHILIIDKDNCLLYEIYRAYQVDNNSWEAGSGAIFDLRSNSLRPDTWTSADAAGLPILPGLVRYEEVATGEINHALRFTAVRTRKQHIWPARHDASSITDENVPPMGQRFRLKSSFDISSFSPQVQVILIALKKYGMFLADNGSNWYISGSPNLKWDDETLVNELRRVKGSDFEAIDESELIIDPNSGQAN